jgi:hypothetical protein
VVLLVLYIALGHASDLYFKEDHYTGAEYLRLAADGRYERILREHMGVWVADRGKWQESEGTIVLESDRLLREIVAPAGRIPVSDASRVRLPDLRIKLQALMDMEPVSEPIHAFQLASISVESGEGGLRVELVPAVEARGLVSRGEFQSLLSSIDEYLLSQLRHRSRSRLETHRGVTFLVSMGEGVRSPIVDAEETRSQIDELDGGIPAYVLAEVPQQVYECEIRETYPFRIVPVSCPRHR